MPTSLDELVLSTPIHKLLASKPGYTVSTPYILFYFWYKETHIFNTQIPFKKTKTKKQST